MPITQQKSLWLKLLEPLAAVAALTALLALTTIVPAAFEATLGLVVTALFAAYYGLGVGLYTAALVLLAQCVLHGPLRGGDILSQLWTMPQLLAWSTMFLLAILLGNLTTARRERYDDLAFANQELHAAQAELDHTLTVVTASKDALKEKLLATDNQTSVLFDIFRVVDRVAPEFVPATVVRMLEKHLGARQVAIYEYRSDGLRVVAASKHGVRDIPLMQCPPVIRQAFSTDSPVFRGPADPLDAPTLVSAVHVEGQLAYLITVDDVAFDQLTTQNYILFSWFTRILGTRMETAQLWEAGYPTPVDDAVAALVVNGK